MKTSTTTESNGLMAGPVKCPIGMDYNPGLCSAGTCQKCQELRRAGKQKCLVCHGVGKQGMPGQICTFCGGTGHAPAGFVK